MLYHFTIHRFHLRDLGHTRTPKLPANIMSVQLNLVLDISSTGAYGVPYDQKVVETVLVSCCATSIACIFLQFSSSPA
jgi:hypothetical protein